MDYPSDKFVSQTTAQRQELGLRCYDSRSYGKKK